MGQYMQYILNGYKYRKILNNVSEEIQDEWGQEDIQTSPSEGVPDFASVLTSDSINGVSLVLPNLTSGQIAVGIGGNFKTSEIKEPLEETDYELVSPQGSIEMYERRVNVNNIDYISTIGVKSGHLIYGLAEVGGNQSLSRKMAQSIEHEDARLVTRFSSISTVFDQLSEMDMHTTRNVAGAGGVLKDARVFSTAYSFDGDTATEFIIIGYDSTSTVDMEDRVDNLTTSLSDEQNSNITVDKVQDSLILSTETTTRQALGLEENDN